MNRVDLRMSAAVVYFAVCAVGMHSARASEDGILRFSQGEALIGDQIEYKNIPFTIKDFTGETSRNSECLIEFDGEATVLKKAGFSFDNAESIQRPSKGSGQVIALFRVTPRELFQGESIEYIEGEEVELTQYHHLKCRIKEVPEDTFPDAVYVVEYKGSKSIMENAGLTIDDAQSVKRDRKNKDSITAFFNIQRKYLRPVFEENGVGVGGFEDLERASSQAPSEILESIPSQMSSVDSRATEQLERLQERMKDIANLANNIHTKQVLPAGTPVKIHWEESKPKSLEQYKNLKSGTNGFVSKVPATGDNENFEHEVEMYNVIHVQIRRKKIDAAIECLKERKGSLMLEDPVRFFTIAGIDTYDARISELH